MDDLRAAIVDAEDAGTRPRQVRISHAQLGHVRRAKSGEGSGVRLFGLLVSGDDRLSGVEFLLS